MSQSTHYRICPICEAACGLRVSVDNSEVLEIRGNADDVFSDGHTCAKGIALKDLHNDPDRIRAPLIRKDGQLVEASWEEAYQVIQENLNQLIGDYGRDSIGVYVGNPTAHNIGLSMGFGTFASALGSKNLYTAGTVDQVPKQLASELMFGNDMAVPIPDIQNCDFFLMLGANPVVSNGSFWVVPKIRDKIRALKERGGQLVTIDPRRTETARLADQHYYIRPGTDAYLLTAIINLLAEHGATVPERIATEGSTELLSALASITLSQASQACGVTEEEIKSLVERIVNASHPVVYGRVGTTLQAFGTLTSFLIEVINLLTDSLDERGGAMFPEQPFHSPKSPYQGLAHNRFQSRVSQVPEVLGQLPVGVLAEEIETPGAGQIRGLVCFAGNPVLSNPDSDRLGRALDQLDFIVCIDIYQTETSSKADVVLPGSSAFEESHYDQFLGSMGYKNAARYSPPMFEAKQPLEWDIGLTLGYLAQHGAVPSERQLREYEDTVVAAHVSAQVNDPESGIYQRDVQEIVAAIEPAQGVERILDVGIRAGRWGDHFGKRGGLTLGQLADTPNGVDLGKIREHRVHEVTYYPDGNLQLAPPMIMDEITRVMDEPPIGELTLIGRRSTRTNNTWLRNLPNLTKGSELCHLLVHPTDAAAKNVVDGDKVTLTGPGGAVTVEVKITEDIARGVVCLPHGFDDQSDVLQSELIKGPNYNRVAGVMARDKPSGTAALNGIPVALNKTAPMALSQ